MRKEKKNSEFLNCKIEKETAEHLKELCNETGLSKTVATERAIELYYKQYKDTGKI